MKPFTQIILFSALLTLSFPLSQYTYTFNTVTDPISTTYTPVYSLGNMIQNYTIQITFSSQSFQAHADSLLPSSLSALVEDSTTGVPLATCTVTPSPEVFKYQQKCRIPGNSTYRLRYNQVNTPANTAGSNNPIVLQHFHLLVTYYNATGDLSVGNNNMETRLKVTDVFRDRVTRLLYLTPQQSLNFMMYPVDNLSLGTGNPDTPVTTQTLRLFKVDAIRSTNNIYSSSTSDVLSDPAKTTWTYSSVSKTLNFRVAEGQIEEGFYILVASYQPANEPYIKITYQSEQYICPYDLYYPDANSIFQPCVREIPADISNQCLAYDFILGVCTQCMHGFYLVEGSCHTNTACPDRYYFHFGSCLAVDSSCDKYDIFTGKCLTCKDFSFELVNQTCIERTVECSSRQYVYNYTCVDVDIDCKTFSNTTGECTSCYPGFTVNNGKCQKNVVVCDSMEYLDKLNQCQPYPPQCLIFNANQIKCQICHPGYSLNQQGTCTRIQCPARTYPSPFGEGNACLSVSPLCDTYDDITGDCLTCIMDYTVREGQCKQVTSALAGCKQREELGFGPCEGNQVNCETFNLVTLNCVICKEGFHLDYRGICIADQVCTRSQWNNNGICLELPPNCKDVDEDGTCYICFKGFKLIEGYCYEIKRCLDGQYLTANNQCVDIPLNCMEANPSTGQCYLCAQGYHMSGGYCCPQGQIYTGFLCTAMTPQQLVSLAQTSPTCILFHPQLGFCLQCKSGYHVDPFTRKTCIGF